MILLMLVPSMESRTRHLLVFNTGLMEDSTACDTPRTRTHRFAICTRDAYQIGFCHAWNA